MVHSTEGEEVELACLLITDALAFHRRRPYLAAKPEDWRRSSHRHYQTGIRGSVEIESAWAAQHRGAVTGVDAPPAARLFFPGPQKRGTGGTFNWQNSSYSFLFVVQRFG